MANTTGLCTQATRGNLREAIDRLTFVWRNTQSYTTSKCNNHASIRHGILCARDAQIVFSCIKYNINAVAYRDHNKLSFYPDK